MKDLIIYGASYPDVIKLIDVINRRSFGWRMELTVDPGILMTAVTLAFGAALAAGLYPAWRAANARPATAMREE